MCVNKDSVPPEDLTRMSLFINALQEGSPLRGFMTSIYEAITLGDGFCFQAFEVNPETETATPVTMQQGAGIYPPGTFPTTT